MTWSDWEPILTVITGVIAVGAFLFGIMSLWYRILLQSKIGTIDKSLKALLAIHEDELIAFYKKHSLPIFNPATPEEKNALLDNLQQDRLTRQEADRLMAILKEEEAEAKRKGELYTTLGVAAVLALLYMWSELQKKKSATV